MMKHYFLLHTLLLFIPLSTIAQEETKTISLDAPIFLPNSPEASAVERYVDYPVDHSTGLANISIPLYEVKVGDIALPISLSYHSAGLRPRENSGILGVGWTLVCDPAVTRSIQGLPDEVKQNGYEGYLVHTLPDVISNAYLRQVVDNRKYDWEPDRFSYRLASQSGTFYPNAESNHAFRTQPNQHIKISPIANDTLSKFTITDENGVIYLFGGSKEIFKGQTFDFREFTGSQDHEFPTRWLCQDITSSRTGAKITFKYYDGYQMTPFPPLCDKVMLNDDHSGYTEAMTLTSTYDIKGTESQLDVSNGQVSIVPDSLQQIHVDLNLPSLFAGNTVKVKLLEKIEFDNGRIEFYYTEDGYPTLKRIDVHNKSGKIIRTIKFYVQPYNMQSDLKKLTQVRIGAPKNREKVYSFTYHKEELVPEQTTKNLDHWGFYNNNMPTVVGQAYVPTITTRVKADSQSEVSYTIAGVNKGSDPNCAKIGMLETILNPEDIETRFEYEGNQSSRVSNGMQVKYNVGGLRIKKITAFDQTGGRAQYREYSYKHIRPTNELDGVGVARHYVTANDYETVQYYKRRDGRWRVRTWHSMPVSNITFHNGSAVLYQTVREEIYNNQEKDKKLINVYSYHVPSLMEYASGSADRERHDFIRPEDLEMPFDLNYQEGHLYGQLDSVATYADVASESNLISKTIYTYAERPATNQVDRITIKKAYKPQSYVFSPGEPELNETKNDNELYKQAEWELKQNRKELIKETQIQVVDGRSIKTEKEYSYREHSEGHHHPIKIVTTYNDSDIQTEHFRYSGEGNTFDLDTDEKLDKTGIMTELLEHKVVNSSNPNDTICVQRLFANKRLTSVRRKMGDSPWATELTIHRYDGYGNIVETSGLDGIRTSYLWSYNNQYPITKIEGVAYQQVLDSLSYQETSSINPFVFIENTRNANDLSINNPHYVYYGRFYRQKFPDAFVTNYLYEPLLGSVVSVTDPADIRTDYQYDGYGRLTDVSQPRNDGTLDYLQKNVYNLELPARLAPLEPTQTPNNCYVEFNLTEDQRRQYNIKAGTKHTFSFTLVGVPPKKEDEEDRYFYKIWLYYVDGATSIDNPSRKTSFFENYETTEREITIEIPQLKNSSRASAKLWCGAYDKETKKLVLVTYYDNQAYFNIIK